METIKIKDGSEYIIDSVGYQITPQPKEVDEELVFSEDNNDLKTEFTDLELISNLAISELLFLVDMVREEIVVPASGSIELEDFEEFTISRMKNGYIELVVHFRIGDYWGAKYWENSKVPYQWVIGIVRLREVARS